MIKKYKLFKFYLKFIILYLKINIQLRKYYNNNKYSYKSKINNYHKMNKI